MSARKDAHHTDPSLRSSWRTPLEIVLRAREIPVLMLLSTGGAVWSVYAGPLPAGTVLERWPLAGSAGVAALWLSIYFGLGRAMLGTARAGEPRRLLRRLAIAMVLFVVLCAPLVLVETLPAVRRRVLPSGALVGLSERERSARVVVDPRGARLVGRGGGRRRRGRRAPPRRRLLGSQIPARTRRVRREHRGAREHARCPLRAPSPARRRDRHRHDALRRARRREPRQDDVHARGRPAARPPLRRGALTAARRNVRADDDGAPRRLVHSRADGAPRRGAPSGRGRLVARTSHRRRRLARRDRRRRHERTPRAAAACARSRGHRARRLGLGALRAAKRCLAR